MFSLCGVMDMLLCWYLCVTICTEYCQLGKLTGDTVLRVLLGLLLYMLDMFPGHLHHMTQSPHKIMSEWQAPIQNHIVRLCDPRTPGKQRY